MTLARRMSYPPTVSPAAEVSDLGLARRSAFTLIELLVVIVIIGILAGMAMAVMFQAQEAARRSRTEGIVGMLSNQMAIRWETYRTRRLPTSTVFATTMSSLPNPSDMQQVASLQLIARRQLMRIELPDRWWDVAFDDTDESATTVWIPKVPDDQRVSKDAASVMPGKAWNGSNGPAIGMTQRTNVGTLPWSMVERVGVDLIQRTSLSLAYQRRYQQVIQQRTAAPTRQYQGAECLYMILTTGMGDESTGGGTFNERDFADVDDDGMPEFIDGWGKPISFLRWAPGFRSDMQSGDPVSDHDPFDPRRADALAFRLFPLISSAGPDGVNDDGVNVPMGIENHSNPFDPASDDVNLNDPYAPAPSSMSSHSFRGDLLPETAGIGPNDNIFNQALQIR